LVTGIIDTTRSTLPAMTIGSRTGRDNMRSSSLLSSPTSFLASACTSSTSKPRLSKCAGSLCGCLASFLTLTTRRPRARISASLSACAAVDQASAATNVAATRGFILSV